MRKVILLLFICLFFQQYSKAEYFSAPKQALHSIHFKNESLKKELQNCKQSKQSNLNFIGLSDQQLFELSTEDQLNYELLSIINALLKNDIKKAIQSLLKVENNFATYTQNDSALSAFYYLKYISFNQFHLIINPSEFEKDLAAISKPLTYFLLYKLIETDNFSFLKIPEQKKTNLISLSKSISNYDYIKSLGLYLSKQTDGTFLKLIERDSILNVLLLSKNKLAYNEAVYYTNFSNPAEFETQLKIEKLISENDLGCWYRKATQYEKSIAAFETALSLQKNVSNKKLEPELFLNYGICLTLMNRFQEAEVKYQQALSLATVQGDKTVIAESHNFLAKNQFLDTKNQLSINSCLSSLNFSLGSNDYKNAAESYKLLSEIYSDEGDFQESNKYYKQYSEFKKLSGDEEIKKNNQRRASEIQNENIASELGVELKLEAQKKAELLQIKLESAKKERDLLELKKEAELNQVKLAFDQLEKEKSLQALALTEEKLRLKKKELVELENQNKLHLLEKYINQKKLEIAEKTNFSILQNQTINQLKVEGIKKNQRILKLVLTLLFLLLMVAFGALLWGIKNRNKIKAQNLHLSKQNEEIEKNRNLILTKNTEIIDSINYALKIQSALLPTDMEMLNALGNIFIFYKPKDIVSGDFYWLHKTDKYIFYATADCTGHGVPGGFMSMLGMSLLNEIVKDKKIEEPGDILDLLSAKIVSELKQTDQKNASKDGMDITLCRINKEKTELCFASANNDLWLVRNHKLEIYKSDRQPVGFHFGLFKQFNQQRIELQKGDEIFTFSDGFADQFGGHESKKFKYLNQKRLFLSIAGLSSLQQKTIVAETFHNWKGEIEQVDDILIMGLSI